MAPRVVRLREPLRHEGKTYVELTFAQPNGRLLIAMNDVPENHGNTYKAFAGAAMLAGVPVEALLELPLADAQDVLAAFAELCEGSGAGVPLGSST
jgi:hypothetical protein